MQIRTEKVTSTVACRVSRPSRKATLKFELFNANLIEPSCVKVRVIGKESAFCLTILKNVPLNNLVHLSHSFVQRNGRLMRRIKVKRQLHVTITKVILSQLFGQ
jgi:hypothetical protein